MKNQELLPIIGQLVKYSVQKDEEGFGYVMDKIDKKEKPEDQFTVTGYLIKIHNTRKIVPISYWRILEVLDNESQIFEIELKGKGELPGGYNRAKRKPN